MQDSPGDQESGAVGGGVVGETDLDAILGKFVGVGGFNDYVTVNARVSDLTDDVLVCKTDDQSGRK